MSSGKEGCECIDQTSVLKSLQNRDCTTSDGQPGVQLTLGGSCVSYDYGSGTCLQHDYIYNPVCQGDPSSSVVPPWCFQSWCYVDANSCKKYSDEDIYKSDYFDSIFFSYSTCNSTDYFWQQQLGSSATNASVIGGISLTSIVPSFQYPTLNKQLPDGTFVYHRPDNDVYMDDSLPFGGVYIDYVNSLVAISNGDIRNITYTHTSRASLKRYPGRNFTAAVQDVENGLVDMAVGPFWITGQRLKMTAFTVPVVYDKTVLVIPKPGKKSSLAYEVQKVFDPFTAGLWGVFIAVTLLAALLSVWFSDREMIAKRNYRARLSQRKRPHISRKGIYLRLILDAILEKGMFFFSAGIEQDVGASLPHKVLMFGFGFFILIAVSAYVANLAAFLTQSGLQMQVGTIRKVVEGNIPICGHPGLEEEIRFEWPDGNWLFPKDGYNGPNGMFEAYERGDCQVLAVGREDTIMNRDILEKVCDLGLIYTESVVTENPIAFPIRPQLASAFSYWMHTGEKSYDVSLESAKRKYIQESEFKTQCEVELSNLNVEEVDDFARVSPKNMFFPIMAFLACAFIAVILQLVHDRKRKQGHTSELGRKSTLEIFQLATRNRSQRDENTVMLKTDDKNDDGGDDLVPITNSFSDVDDANRGADIPRDDFMENEAPQSIQDTGLEENEIRYQIDELVESGAVDEVLDLFWKLKKLKKDQ